MDREQKHREQVNSMIRAMLKGRIMGWTLPLWLPLVIIYHVIRSILVGAILAINYVLYRFRPTKIEISVIAMIIVLIIVSIVNL